MQSLGQTIAKKMSLHYLLKIVNFRPCCKNTTLTSQVYKNRAFSLVVEGFKTIVFVSKAQWKFTYFAFKSCIS